MGVPSLEGIDRLFDIWKRENPQLLSLQLRGINSELANKKIFVLIDEIDRLPSDGILDFLLFTRILECFDNMICVVAIDYQQVINKLIQDKSLGSIDYYTAFSYLDKLFQLRINIVNTINVYEMSKFTKKQIRRLTYQGFSSLLENEIKKDSRNEGFFEKIVFYLSTPRLINKFAMNIYAYIAVIEQSDNKLHWFALIAIFTKYPIILDNIVRYCLGPISNRLYFLYEIDKQYGTNFSKEKDRDVKINVLLALSGVKRYNKEDNKDNPYETLIRKVTQYPIDDVITCELLTEFYRQTEGQLYLLSLLMTGFRTKDELVSFRLFFNGNVNKGLEFMIEPDNQEKSYLLATDIAYGLHLLEKPLLDNPSIKLLNKLWLSGDCEEPTPTPYRIIVSFLLRHISIKKIIENAVLSMSVNFITDLISLFQVQNIDGIYDFNLFDAEKVPSFSAIVYDEKKTINQLNKTDITELITAWLEKVDVCFHKGDDNNLFKQSSARGKTTILYRYIQWKKALYSNGAAAEEDLSKNVLNYLNSIDDKDKKTFLSALGLVCFSFVSPEGVTKENPFDYFFNHHEKLECLINILVDKLYPTNNEEIKECLEIKNVKNTAIF